MYVSIILPSPLVAYYIFILDAMCTFSLATFENLNALGPA